MVAAGFSGLGDYFASQLEEVPGWMAARVGDVAIVEEGGFEAAGIVGGAQIHGLGVGGMQALALSRAIRVLRP